MFSFTIVNQRISFNQWSSIFLLTECHDFTSVKEVNNSGVFDATMKKEIVVRVVWQYENHRSMRGFYDDCLQSKHLNGIVNHPDRNVLFILFQSLDFFYLQQGMNTRVERNSFMFFSIEKKIGKWFRRESRRKSLISFHFFWSCITQKLMRHITVLFLSVFFHV
jgi:hypothetical protein